MITSVFTNDFAFLKTKNLNSKNNSAKINPVSQSTTRPFSSIYKNKGMNIAFCGGAIKKITPDLTTNEYDEKGNIIKTINDATINGKRTITIQEFQPNKTIKTIKQLDKKGCTKSEQIVTVEKTEDGSIETTQKIVNGKTVFKNSTQITTSDKIKTKIKITSTPKFTTIETVVVDSKIQKTTYEKFGKNGEFIQKTITKKYDNNTEEIESIDKNGNLESRIRTSIIKDEDDNWQRYKEEYDASGNLTKSGYDREFREQFENSKIKLIKSIFPNTENMSEKQIQDRAVDGIYQFFDDTRAKNTVIQDWIKTELNNPDYKTWKENLKEQSVILPAAGNSKLAQKLNELSDTSEAQALKLPVRDVATKNKAKILSDWFENILSDIVNDKDSADICYAILTQLTQTVDSFSAHIPKKYDKNILNKTLDTIKLNIALNKSITKNIIEVYKDLIIKKTINEIASEDFDIKNQTGWVKINKENANALNILSHETWCISSASCTKYLDCGEVHIYFEKGKPTIGIWFEFQDSEASGNNLIIKEIQGIKNDGTIPSDKIDIIKNMLTSLGFNFEDLYSKNPACNFDIDSDFNRELEKLNTNLRVQLQNATLEYYIKNNLIDKSSSQKDLFKILGINYENLKKTDEGMYIIPNNYLANTTIEILKNAGLFYLFINNCDIDGIQYKINEFDNNHIEIKNPTGITINRIIDKDGNCVLQTYTNSKTKDALDTITIDDCDNIVFDGVIYEANSDDKIKRNGFKKPLYDENGKFAGMDYISKRGSMGLKYEFDYSKHEYYDTFGKLLSIKEILKSKTEIAELNRNSNNEYTYLKITNIQSGKSKEYSVVCFNDEKNIVVKDADGREYIYNLFEGKLI